MGNISATTISATNDLRRSHWHWNQFQPAEKDFPDQALNQREGRAAPDHLSHSVINGLQSTHITRFSSQYQRHSFTYPGREKARTLNLIHYGKEVRISPDLMDDC